MTQIRWGGKWVHLAYIWIISHLSAKNYRNWWKFDEVLTKTNLLSFFGTRCRIIVLPDTADRTIISSFIWTKHRNVMDGRMERSPLAITALALRAMRTCCKNGQIPAWTNMISGATQLETGSIADYKTWLVTSGTLHLWSNSYWHHLMIWQLSTATARGKAVQPVAIAPTHAAKLSKLILASHPTEG